uniref:Uncharacterized protein n=1 Tax=Anguilla anguilla TaxID=7936 RepID=A0A0E9QWR1_ANGAN
MCRLTPDSERD